MGEAGLTGGKTPQHGGNWSLLKKKKPLVAVMGNRGDQVVPMGPGLPGPLILRDGGEAVGFSPLRRRF